MSMNYRKHLDAMCRAGERADALGLARALNQAAGDYCNGLINEEELSRLVDASDDILWRLERDRAMNDEEN